VKKVEQITHLNVVLNREVGDSMYEKGSVVTKVETKAKLLAAVSADLEVGHKLNIANGAGGTLLTRSLNQEPALCFNTSGIGQATMTISGSGQAIGCLVDTDKDGTFDVSMFSMYEKYFPLPAKVPYEIVSRQESEVEVKGALRQDFLYQGLAKGVIRVSYREFKDGISRPAFTQDLSYELNQDGSGDIGFRGMRMKVISATNQGIKYTVEKHLN
jgi:hypothetical protein